MASSAARGSVKEPSMLEGDGVSGSVALPSPAVPRAHWTSSTLITSHHEHGIAQNPAPTALDRPHRYRGVSGGCSARQDHRSSSVFLRATLVVAALTAWVKPPIDPTTGLPPGDSGPWGASNERPKKGCFQLFAG